jgi:hypothetical protein
MNPEEGIRNHPSADAAELDIQVAEQIFLGNGEPADIRILFGHALNVVRSTTVGEHAVRPKIVLSASPLPNASAALMGPGVLRLNLGLASAFLALPSVMATLRTLLSARDHLGLEELAATPIADDHIREIDALVASWKHSMDSGWREIRFPGTAQPDWTLYRLLNSLVVYHELGHLAKLYEAKDSYEKRATRLGRLLTTWLAENRKDIAQFLGPNRAKALEDVRVRERWTEEALADYIAYATVYQSATSAAQAADVNCAIALLFCLLELLEGFLELHDKPPSIESHPPASLRRDIFTYLQADRRRVSERDYITVHWGAGLATTFIMKSIQAQYLKARA